MLALGVGCAPPPEAPEGLPALGPWLFAHFEDDAALGVGAPALLDALGGVDLAGPAADRAFVLDPLALAALEALPVSARVGDPQRARAVGLAGQSPAPVEAVYPLIGLADLAFLSSTAEAWSRVGDATTLACLPEGCTHEAVDEITRRTPLFEWTSTHARAWRVVDTEAGPALAARAWITDVIVASGNSTLTQQWEVELWVPSEAGPVRLHALWTDANYAGFSDELAWRADRDGAEDSWQRMQVWLDPEAERR